jgi:hypothetical protein
MRWRQEEEKARGLRADKKVECEKTRRNTSGLKKTPRERSETSGDCSNERSARQCWPSYGGSRRWSTESRRPRLVLGQLGLRAGLGMQVGTWVTNVSSASIACDTGWTEAAEEGPRGEDGS